MSDHTERVGFGGGCHWCTEAVFQSLQGVADVVQGFVRSEPPHDEWSEAVLVTFDPSIIELVVLIEIHLRTHSSMSNHKMRHKYRSAVYTFSDGQKLRAENLLKALQPGFEKPLVTLVLPHSAFRHSDERFQDYYSRNPDRPFCQSYIDPKLRLLRERFSERVRV
jgi:peptide-methionine (S)-S-oxide reductase